MALQLAIPLPPPVLFRQTNPRCKQQKDGKKTNNLDTKTGQKANLCCWPPATWSQNASQQQVDVYQMLHRYGIKVQLTLLVQQQTHSSSISKRRKHFEVHHEFGASLSE